MKDFRRFAFSLALVSACASSAPPSVVRPVRVRAVSRAGPPELTPTLLPERDGLLGLDIQLNFKPVLIDGVEYVATSTTVAAALINVFEERVPALVRIVKKQDQIIAIQKDVLHRSDRSTTLALSAIDDAQASRDAWRASAKAAKPTLLERIFLGKELWLAIGIVAGGVLGALFSR